MPRILTLVAAACALAALTAPLSNAYPVSATSLAPAWLDPGPALTMTIDTTAAPADDPEPPAPAPETCPDRPVSLTPIAACQFDPDVYYLWTGDDADAPLWTRCNYQAAPGISTLDGGNPCPHSTPEIGYVRCAGEVWSVFRFDDDGNDVYAANADDACLGADWVDLSTP